MQPPPYYLAPYPNAPPPAPPHDGKATTSLVFGVLSLVGSMCYLGWLFGIVAIVLGVTSRREIARSQGSIGGGGTAIAGIVTGSIGLGISLLYLAFVVAMWTFAMKSATHLPAAPRPTPVYPTAAPTAPSSASAATPVPTTLASMAHVTDLHPDGGSLKTQLVEAQKRAAAMRTKLLLVTMSAESEECGDIARAWGDARVQSALANVSVVRVDVDEFHADLVSARMDRPDAPWFFLLGKSANALDAISADEWGANDARNMAPVIAKFVRGTLTTRKSSGRGAPL